MADSWNVDCAVDEGVMHRRASQLIADLGLKPHPEGGYYRETYRSVSVVTVKARGVERVSLTSIYFLLSAGDISRWHRVSSDEVWHHYEGDPLELLIAEPGFEHVEHLRLGPVGDGTRPVQVAPAGQWQAARSLGAFTLVGCTVGPGFEFDDFAMLRDLPADASAAVRRHPHASAFL